MCSDRSCVVQDVDVWCSYQSFVSTLQGSIIPSEALLLSSETFLPASRPESSHESDQTSGAARLSPPMTISEVLSVRASSYYMTSCNMAMSYFYSFKQLLLFSYKLLGLLLLLPPAIQHGLSVQPKALDLLQSLPLLFLLQHCTL